LVGIPARKISREQHHNHNIETTASI